MVRSIIASLTVCLLFAGTAFAAELSIGVVDMEVVGSQCDANTAAKNKYEAQLKTEIEQLDKQKADFDKKSRDFEAQRAKLDQKNFERRVANLRKEAQEIGEKDMRTQQRFNIIQGAVNQDLAELAVEAAREVAREKGLDVILTQNTILYAGQSYDVTQDLLTAVNRVWKERGSKVPGADADVPPPVAAPAAAKPKKK